MTDAPRDDDQAAGRPTGTRSEVSEADGPVNGADAVPDKTADTPAKGATFDEDEGSPGSEDTSEQPGAGADTSIRDQRD